MAHTISKDGTRIAFGKVGTGPALVIVSGALSQRLPDDHPLIAELAPHFTVYTYDRRGRGGSSDTRPYAVMREIEDLAAVIDKTGGSALVYGVSSGAALSLQAAAALGADKIARLAIYDAPYGQEKQDSAEQRHRIHEILATGAPGDAASFFLSEIGTPPEALAALKESPEWEMMKKIDFTLAYDYAVLGNGAIPRDVVKQIAVPALVMSGEKSLPFMHTTAEQLGKLIPNARQETLAGQAHQADPKVVVPVLVEFFRS